MQFDTYLRRLISLASIHALLHAIAITKAKQNKIVIIASSIRASSGRSINVIYKNCIRPPFTPILPL